MAWFSWIVTLIGRAIRTIPVSTGFPRRRPLLMFAHWAYSDRMGTTAVKDDRITVRTTRDQKHRIAEASSITGQSITDFTLSVALARADEVLADQRTFHVPADRWDEFEALMNAPVEPNPGVVDLFSKPSGFVPR